VGLLVLVAQLATAIGLAAEAMADRRPSTRRAVTKREL
jgi:hypothetical protein